MENIYGVSDAILKSRPSYVYKITFKKDGRIYYGSRISSSFLVDDDLWVKYFTSSKIILGLMEHHEPYGDDWKYEVIDQFALYSDAVKLEDTLLRAVPKSERNLYLNLNFSAGGSIIKSNRHAKYLNNETGSIELFPLGTPLPVGYTNNNQVPPSRKGYRCWIIPLSGVTGIGKLENFPDGAIPKSVYEQIKKDEARSRKATYQKSRTNHVITDGKTNKTVYSDLQIPYGWIVGKTTFSGGMKGKTHSQETRNLMAQNMKGSKSNINPWNKGLTKETSEKIQNMSASSSQFKKGDPGHVKCVGMRKFYNINTGEERMSHELLDCPWKYGSRATAMMTPYGIVCNYDELESGYGMSRFLFMKRTKEFPHEWYYLHPKD